MRSSVADTNEGLTRRWRVAPVGACGHGEGWRPRVNWREGLREDARERFECERPWMLLGGAVPLAYEAEEWRPERVLWAPSAVSGELAREREGLWERGTLRASGGSC